MSAKELKYNFPFLILDSIRNDCSFARLETEFLFYKKMAHIFGRWDDPLKRICNQCKRKFTANNRNQCRCDNCEQRANQKKCKSCNKYFNPKYNKKICPDCILIRKQRYKKKNPVILKAFNVFERDNFRCAYCGKTSYEDNVKLIVEHIYPRDKGGTNEGHNIITACSDCNARKGTKIMDWNVILTLWQIVDKRNKEKNIDWNSLKDVFDKQYKTKL